MLFGDAPRRGLHLLDCVEALAVGEADEADLSSAIAHLQAAAELDRQGCGNQGLACTWEGLIAALRLEWLPGWETTTGPGGFTGTEEERLALDAESAELDRLQCDLLREVMGNPFRPTTFEPRWRTVETLGLAQTIWHDRVFEQMPILADALEDAGCDAADLLGHCRGPGPHVRGCWALDMVLGYRR